MIEPLFLRIDDLGDCLRVILLVACCISFTLLMHKFFEHRGDWNTKTRDYWYALVMWSVAGISFGLEGIIRDRPLGPTLVFVFAASIISVKGAVKKGSWGGN